MANWKTIHTLNARGNVLLEVMKEHFALTPAHMFNEIRAMRDEVELKLRAKAIEYSKLRSALVPDRKRREAAFIFDTDAIPSNWYGRDVFDHLLPLLDKAGNNSVLVGDYVADPGNEKFFLAAMESATDLVHNVVVRHPSQLYIVYLNNLSETMIASLRRGLTNYPGYVGFADTTYASTFKTMLSTILVNLGLKHGRVFLQGHEDDRDDADDVNMCGYPFQQYGYTPRSIGSQLMGVLLSYKIERPVYSGFETDTEFSLNAISQTPMPLDDFEIEVAEAKLRYVETEKSASAARAGIVGMTPEELSEAIRQKVQSNYIYSLSFDTSLSVAKFNVILEFLTPEPFKRSRHLASLEYKSAEKRLRLITLF